MKILVFAHRLEIGGTQVNAIELAAALRDLHGHEILLFATPGPLAKLAEEKRLRFIAAPDARIHPSPARMRALREVVRRERPALVHAWDWWQCLDAYYAVHLMMRVPMVVTDMMMDLTCVLPKDLPTTFGTPELVERARAAGRRRVELIMPPVDVAANASGAVDPQPLRARCRISPHEIVLVTVSRLADFMKAESLLRTIDVVRVLGRELPLRFVIVGDGADRPSVEALARATNDELGRDAVVLTGALIDPRPAYAMADIVVGMGGSALRGMAFSKPVVVVGERGFAQALTPRTMEFFRYKGMYGVGDGHPGNDGFAATVRELATDASLRQQLGAHARNFVVKEYSLETISTRLDSFCKQAVSHPSRLHTATADGLRTAAVYLRERRFLTPSRDVAPRPTLLR
jgi:glycosyltransferase involved in cell wall biosynthesis